jgi:hypothetical protein
MDINTALQVLRDPFGLPFYAWMFQGLLVLTFALHILVVNLAVGGIAVAMYCHFKGGAYRQRLANALAKAGTINLSVAIVLGVAPLLFVQVIYDPFWYASNSLSAWWAMAFLLAVAIAFLALYVFYLKRQKNPDSWGGYAVLSLVAVVAAGIIISALSVQALVPGEWLKWYTRYGELHTTGTGLYHFEVGRFLHFMAPAFINTGIFMMLYAWYFRARADRDDAYLDWVGRAGVRLAKIAVMIEIVTGLWWLVALPRNLHFMRDPYMWAGAGLGMILLAVLYRAARNPDRFALPLAAFSLVTVLVMSIAREVLRMSYLGLYNYSIYDCKVNLDWGSTALFLATFVLGLVIIAYPLIVAFKLGRGTLKEAP